MTSPPTPRRSIHRFCLALGAAMIAIASLILVSPRADAAEASEENHLLSRRISDSKITPRSFSHFFSSFGYELNVMVQPPRAFLTRRKGDCDDYAVLADAVLPHHGYSTRLIHVRLAGKIAHAVCYIEEDRVYLDYNNRDYFFTLARSKPALAEIADKVADSLRAHWTTASEFEYCYDSKRKTFTTTVAKIR